jgi:serine/threonine protein kinase
MADCAATRQAYLKMLLSGVRACHDNFMVHRDLKPGNLLISTAP